MRARPTIIAFFCVVASVVLLAGCSDPDAPSKTAAANRAPQSAGEPSAPPPASVNAQSPAELQRTPVAALSAFSELYGNWSYRTLPADQRHLAAISVGSARLAEQQAAAGSHAELARGRVWNHAQLISIGRDKQQPGAWVIVTLERTGGDTEYEGLPASYHVTLARLAQLPGGYAISLWAPQT
jgi:outer membrane murein-binding lipoprotein Lpp